MLQHRGEAQEEVRVDEYVKVGTTQKCNLWLSQLQFTEERCDNLKKMLTLRVQRLKDEDRDCVLIADEIALKKSIDY